MYKEFFDYHFLAYKNRKQFQEYNKTTEIKSEELKKD